MKRRDPWPEVNAPPKAVAALGLIGQDVETSYRRVLAWSAGRWRNHQSKQAEKPHSKSSSGDALDGPATRPETPLAVENSVGKLAALEAPNVSMGKRAWRTPTPHFGPCLTLTGRAGVFVILGVVGSRKASGVKMTDDEI